MTINNRYLEKELSWLAFNERVLQEAADKSVPLLERVRFLGIYANNTDEFYKVRVAKIKRQLLHCRDQHHPQQSLLDQIQQRSLQAQYTFDVIYRALLIEMAQRGICLLDEHQLQSPQQQWLKNYFRQHILPHLTTISLPNKLNTTPLHSAPFDLVQRLHHHCAYLAVTIKRNHNVDYALVEIPTDKLPRLVQLPASNNQHQLVWLETIIRYCIGDIFTAQPTTDLLSVYAIKITRDACYALNQTSEDTVLEQLSLGLNQRLTAKPLRLVYQHTMPPHLLNLLKHQLKLSCFDTILAGGRYQHINDFIDFPLIGNKYFNHAPLPTIKSYPFSRAKTVFDAIKAQDILLYYPYHSFDHVIDFVRQAALDPMVSQIRINIYRVAKRSTIIDSLITAANNGKQVTAVVELQARFDEQANIRWARRLIAAGITVLFGVVGVKIHSKLCLISRQEQHQLVHYAHIGTGNFNEQTATTYTDFSLFTAHPQITDEVRQLFDYIANPTRKVHFNYLIVSPTDTRARLYALIDREIDHAQQHHPAGITLKLNNLIDKGLIDQLYKASQHGVKIQLIVRGMCSLIAGLKGISDNITVISIVDRFLEHARVYIFTNNGSPKVFISSADWMYRNIDRRIEVGCPILSPVLKQRIINITNLQLADNVKARLLDQSMSNRYVSRGKQQKIRAQTAIYHYLQRSEDHWQRLANKEQKYHAKP
ncbi:polyphosphate kinase 1 [Photobacterium phosphoreum]|uniref:polyphosphate kinase 1 n=1 Tax=Photobacterium phosphoreum TaxID=659 RepID=UPI000D1646AA|nr:polyphosphate kinase 1 [Photobacterium phosphoreum]PSU71319.1 polyphosphate kinase 1 [Photobacterium phosphoreum]